LIVFAIFLADLVLGLLGMEQLAPFKYANWIMDTVFVVCALSVGILAWQTYKEQV
jgi:hypothetical protein